MGFVRRVRLPQRRWLRWTVLSLASIAVLLAVLEWAGWPFLREPLERRLAGSLARDVDIGPQFKLRLIGSIRLHSDSLRIGSPDGAPVVHDRDGVPQPFIDARDLRLVLPYSTIVALLRGDDREAPLRVRSLDVQRLELGLARRSDGTANWQIGPPKPQESEPKLPQFGHLAVHDGRLRLDDAQTRLVLDATLKTSEGAAGGSEAGHLEVKAVGRYHDSPLKAQLRSSGVLPLAAPAEDGTATVPLRFELHAGKCHLELDGRAGDLLNLTALDAKVRLAGPSLAALGTAIRATLPNSPPFELRGQLRKNGPVWNGKVVELDLGSSRLQGEFNYDPRPAVPMLSGRLGGAKLALGDLAQAFGDAPGDTEADATPGRVLPQRDFKLSALGAMNADVSVRLDRVLLGTPKLDVLTPLGGRVVLRDRVLSIEDLLARASGGELRGSLSLDARRKMPQWQGDLRWSGVRLEQFVRPRNPTAEGAAAPFIGGVLGGRAKLQGSGSSTAALLGSLDGSAELWLRDGRISSLLTELAGIDLAESLGVAIAGDDDLPVRCAVARFVVRDGVMTPEVAVIDTPDTTLFAAGHISLADERLALTLTARPHDVSLLALRSPVRIAGSFAKPKVNLDASKIGLRVVAAAALAAVTPLAALLALTDFGEQERAVCGDALQRLQSRAAPKRAPPVKDK